MCASTYADLTRHTTDMPRIDPVEAEREREKRTKDGNYKVVWDEEESTPQRETQ